jgi:hypothetical protein
VTAKRDRPGPVSEIAVFVGYRKEPVSHSVSKDRSPGRLRYNSDMSLLSRKAGLLLAVWIPTSVLAGADNQYWRIGRVLDPKEQPYFPSDTLATAPSGLVTCARSPEGESAWYRQFVIEGEAYTYLVQEHIRGKKVSTPTLVLGDEVKYSTDERRIYYLGQDGKRHERVNRKLFVRNNAGETREMEIVGKVKRPLTPLTVCEVLAESRKTPVNRWP